ncbi:hypothetical protein ACZ90_63635 [Streptomyces albus subsp. albus]|nr:hypothetical protein ACZ90_63635 [Streptomyces albus subsp. albus]
MAQTVVMIWACVMRWVMGMPRKRANSAARVFALAPGGTRTHATGIWWRIPVRAVSARWQVRPTCGSAVVFPVVGGPVTIRQGRAVACWCRPRTMRVRTVVEIVSMAGVRTVTNREW